MKPRTSNQGRPTFRICCAMVCQRLDRQAGRCQARTISGDSVSLLGLPISCPDPLSYPSRNAARRLLPCRTARDSLGLCGGDPYVGHNNSFRVVCRVVIPALKPVSRQMRLPASVDNTRTATTRISPPAGEFGGVKNPVFYGRMSQVSAADFSLRWNRHVNRWPDLSPMPQRKDC